MSNNEEQHLKQLKNAFNVGVWRGIAIGLILGALCNSNSQLIGFRIAQLAGM